MSVFCVSDFLHPKTINQMQPTVGSALKGWMERFQWPAPPDHRHTARPSFRLCCCCKTEHCEASQRPTLPPVSLGRLGKQTAPCPKPHSTWDQSAACSVLAEGHADKFPLTRTALTGENSCGDNTGWKKKTNINWLPHGSKLSLGSLGWNQSDLIAIEKEVLFKITWH